MQDNRSDRSASLLDPDELANVVLGMLLRAYPSLQSLDELARLFTGSAGDFSKSRISIQDGLADLMADGLAHQLDGFVFASRSAVRAAALLTRL